MSRILLVDDEKDLLTVAEKFLIGVEPSFDLITSKSVHEALQILTENQIDVVVSDYQMPDQDGLEFLRKLRKTGNKIPFIMFTGRGREFVAMEALNLGADYYLRKEGSFKSLYTDLAHIIKNLIHYKQLEQALEKSEQHFRLMFDNAPLGYQSLSETGHVLEANQAWLDQLGYSQEEVIGRWFGDFLAPDYVEKFRTNFPLFKEAGCIRGIEFKLIRKDGSHVFVKFNGRIGYDESGEFQQTHCIIEDITERKDNVDFLKRKSEELSDFVHVLAHDLQNPLINIIGYADLIQNEHNLPLVERISHLAQKMKKMLIRSVALADAGLVVEMTDNVDLVQVVQDAAECTIPEDVDFILEDLPMVRGDAEKLELVFQNLFENAVSHGKATKIEVKREFSEAGTTIAVSNNGEPIIPRNRAKIFQIGFSSKENGGGLGLAIVQKLVTAHKWQISLSNAPKTTFNIFIPRITGF